jgi:hypothetical protein
LALQLLEFGAEKAVMTQITRLIVVVTILAAGIQPTLVGSQAQERDAKKTGQKKAEGASLSGCVDQQDGQYVLVDDHNLKVVTRLEPDGFPTEGFAKHMGQKVTVRGTNNAGGATPAFKVRRIETVSETCSPQSAQEGKK